MSPAASPGPARPEQTLLKQGALLALTWYKKAVSPYLPSACRYEPTCSRYSFEAIERYGVLKGSWFTVKRLSRCHPLGGRGYDPVP